MVHTIIALLRLKVSIYCGYVWKSLPGINYDDMLETEKSFSTHKYSQQLASVINVLE